jgi:homoserine kinase
VSLDRQPAGHAVEPADMVEPGQAVTVTVPATSANLGPGFDSLGLAVSLYDTVTVRTTVADGITVDVEGEGAVDVPRDASHLVVRTILDTLHRAGYDAPGLALQARNVIPHGRGLGSSASAIVTGVLAANALLPAPARLDGAAVLQLCSSLEGHPDNVAPALSGALAISWEGSRAFGSTRVAVHPEIVPVVAIPAVELSTETARALLPSSVPHQSAAANSGRAALLVHALVQEPQLLLEGTLDSLHQDYRAEAMPASAALMKHLRALGYAAVISGAGPTVMTLASSPAQAGRIQAAIADYLEAAGGAGSWRVLRLNVDTEGAKVEVHQR